MGFVPCTLEELAAALDLAEFDLPHVDIKGLRGPYALAKESLELEELTDLHGRNVVIGDLTVTKDIFIQRVTGMPDLIVTGDLRARYIYADAFLIVGGTLAAHTIVTHNIWDGALFVGALEADTVVLKDCGLEYLGERSQRVRRFADLERPGCQEIVPELFVPDEDEEVDADEPPALRADPYGFFDALPR